MDGALKVTGDGTDEKTIDDLYDLADGLGLSGRLEPSFTDGPLLGIKADAVLEDDWNTWDEGVCELVDTLDHHGFTVNGKIDRHDDDSYWRMYVGNGNGWRHLNIEDNEVRVMRGRFAWAGI